MSDQEARPDGPDPETPSIDFRRTLRAVAAHWPRYLVEVAVVVFSILSAFALENWRDDRSRAAEELTILRAALSGLQSDLDDIDYNTARHREAVASLDLVLAHLETGAPYHDSLAAHFHHGTIMPRFVHSSSAYETLQSRGLDLVSNDEVRNALVRVYGRNYTDYLRAEDDLASEVAYGLRHIMAGRFIEGYGFTEVGSTYRGSTTPLDFEALRSDSEYLYYLRTLRNRRVTFLGFYLRNLRSSVEDTKARVEAEIDRR